MKIVTYEEIGSGTYRISFNHTGKTTKYYNDFLNIIGNAAGSRYDSATRKWIVDDYAMDRLEELDRQAFPPKKSMKEKMAAVIKKDVPAKTVTGWENIGADMKLQPYDYQKKIVKFIVDKHGTDDSNDVLIIAPCGSGKSPTILAAYLECRNRGIVEGAGMIVVKASLKTQWAKEVQKFTGLTPKVIKTYKDCVSKEEGMLKRREAKLNSASSQEARELEKEIKELKKAIKLKFAEQFMGADLFIVNYETLNDEKVQKVLLKISPQFVAADETHYVKGAGNKRSRSLAKFNGAKVKIGATATPVQRDPRDIYGIFKFVHPELFGKAADFNALYVKYGYGYRIIGAKNVEKLNAKIDPYMFILTKEEVASHLPKLVVSQRYCEFTPRQADANQVIMDELDELQEKANKQSSGKSEEALKHDEDYLATQAAIQSRQTFLQELTLSEKLLENAESPVAKKLITGSCDAKMEVLKDTVEEIIDSGEKVCIFSRFASMQRIATDVIHSVPSLKSVGIAYIRGELSSEQRYEEAYTKFRDNDDYKVLLCSDAGAEGLNLSLCKYMIELEPAVSYAIQTQRHGRLERADSVHDTVFVIQLIMQDSWDEIMMKSIAKKEKYDASIIHGIIEAE
jgi:SNF2 family DNA or RNA helicase